MTKSSGVADESRSEKYAKTSTPPSTALALNIDQKIAKMRPTSSPPAYSSISRPCAVQSSAAPTPSSAPPATTTQLPNSPSENSSDASGSVA